MTQEEKAKAYDKAIERAKELLSCCIDDRDRRTKIYRVEDIESIFPDLKESEDELTWLTKYIEEEAYSLSMDIRGNEDRIKLKNLQKALAWLEKQGEQKVNYTTLVETGNGEINALVTGEVSNNDYEEKPADKVGHTVVRDFNSVFSREQVEEIDKRIKESQRLYNAKLRDAMRKVEDFPMTD